MPSKKKPLALTGTAVFLILCFFTGCASQARFSGSFSKRLTETQQEWHFYRRSSFDGYAQPPAVSGAPSPVDPFRLQKILERLVYVSPLRGYPVRAALIPDSQVNASTDGTTIFVTTGLLEAFGGREDLVASVLAHELGHILGHHAADQVSRTTLLDYMSYLTPAFAALPYGGFYGSAAGAALREGAKVRRFSYSRLQENEADAIGVYLAMRAGYDPHGLGDFLEVMPDASGFGPPRTVSIPLRAYPNIKSL